MIFRAKKLSNGANYSSMALNGPLSQQSHKNAVFSGKKFSTPSMMHYASPVSTSNLGFGGPNSNVFNFVPNSTRASEGCTFSRKMSPAGMTQIQQKGSSTSLFTVSNSKE